MSMQLDSNIGRLSNGRFAAGNLGGPGNPNSKQTAMMRQALLSCLTMEDMVAIFKALIEKAKDGNVQAIKMVLHYTLGNGEEGSGVRVQGSGGPPIANGDNGREGSGVGVLGSGGRPLANGVIGGEGSGVRVQGSGGLPLANGVNGEEAQVPAHEPPLGNGVNGDQGQENAQEPPLAIGVNGGGSFLAGMSMPPGQKLSSRALRKLRQAAKKAAQHTKVG